MSPFMGYSTFLPPRATKRYVFFPSLLSRDFSRYGSETAPKETKKRRKKTLVLGPDRSLTVRITRFTGYYTMYNYGLFPKSQVEGGFITEVSYSHTPFHTTYISVPRPRASSRNRQEKKYPTRQGLLYPRPT